MPRYFQLMAPAEERLWADISASSGDRIRIACPANERHLGVSVRTSPLYLEVKHNLRTELMIWAWDVAIHNQLIEKFEHEGFTGFRLRPAIVRFSDGAISSDYQHLVVTGWAGSVLPASGMRQIESCPVCQYRVFSEIKDYERIIDWPQWNGQDFFYVYPFLGRRLCTERVAHFLRANKIRSVYLEEGFEDRKRDRLISKLDISVGYLVNFLPDDLAHRYSKDLGLE